MTIRKSKWTKIYRQKIIGIIYGAATYILIGTIIRLITERFNYDLEGQSIYLIAQLFAIGFSVGTMLLINRRIVTNYQMRRLLKGSYNEMEFALRKLFKEKNFPYQRSQNKADCYQYQFLGYNLVLMIYPYNPKSSEIGRPDQINQALAQLTHTLVIMPEIDAKNEGFAEKLAHAIDEMVA